MSTFLSEGQLGQGLRQLQLVLQVFDNKDRYTKFLGELAPKLAALEKAQAEYTETRRVVDGADARQAAKEQALTKFSTVLDGRQTALDTANSDMKRLVARFEGEKAALAKWREEETHRIDQLDHAASVREKGLDVLAKSLAKREEAVGARETTLERQEADLKSRRDRLEKALGN